MTRYWLLITRYILFLLGIFFLMWGAFLIDAPVHAAVLKVEGVTWEHSFLNLIVRAVSRYGDWPELILFGLIAFFIARAFKNLRWQRIFLIAMIASTIAGGLTNTLRLTTGRTRPRASPAIEQGWYGVYHEGRCLIGISEYNSFPSGHTATAIGFASVILFASPFWGLVAMSLALAIASSRLLLGAHHPSDLLAASILGIGVAWFCWKYTRHE
ncbi:MAG: phosphatase PAP2 family protein [Chthoniobacterales bacterium]